MAALKTNKVDTETVMESLRTVYKQFKQCLVLFTEVIKYPLDHPNET